MKQKAFAVFFLFLISYSFAVQVDPSSISASLYPNENSTFLISITNNAPEKDITIFTVYNENATCLINGKNISTVHFLANEKKEYNMTLYVHNYAPVGVNSVCKISAIDYTGPDPTPASSSSGGGGGGSSSGGIVYRDRNITVYVPANNTITPNDAENSTNNQQADIPNNVNFDVEQPTIQATGFAIEGPVAYGAVVFSLIAAVAGAFYLGRRYK